MKSLNLPDIYRSTNARTLGMWEKIAGTGEIKKEHYYDPTKLALATGIQPFMSTSVSRLIDQLEHLTRDDRLADTLPKQGFHFTFLPLTLPLYDLNAPLPEKVRQLTNIWAGYRGKKIVIRNLRLIALPNQLLLAGVPDELAIALRQSFCEQVLESEWQNELRMRHSNSPLPAPFWHSTILRYGADYLPLAVRQFFFAHQDRDFGEAAGELTLARINYNWTQYYPLEMPRRFG